MTYPRLPDDEYAKAKGQLSINAYGIFNFMEVEGSNPVQYQYGLGVYVDGAVREIVRLAEDFSLRCRGVDKPISLEYIRRRKD